MSRSSGSMKTRDKILQEAKRQLNEEGLDRVTIRSIASALEISPGNLTYHFKNVDAIIYELYLQLVEALSQSIEVFHPDKLSTKWFYDQSVSNFAVMWDYRFLLLDFVTITRRIRPIKEHFRQLVTLRQLQFRMFADQMIANDIMQEERVPGLYDRFILQMIIYSDAWLSDALVHFDTHGEHVYHFYADLMVSSLVPYLTEKGLKEYLAWKADRKEPPFRGYPSILGKM
ncbi:MAG: TetR/AcrR family transcriptional regulator [Saprospiraceae bacterium]|nr:TetR family transcriptional regulator [Lewinella sp.]